MPQTRLTLTATPLTAAAFAPFGDVIEASATATALEANRGTAGRYEGVAVLDLTRAGGSPALSIFRARQPAVLPFRIRQMERHMQGSQAFIPIAGATFLAVVAPPGEKPVPTELRAFLAAGTQGVNYRPGVWHHPLLALRANDDFVVLERMGPGGNLDIVEMDGEIVVIA
jgi:ureidoglycolate lyase